jgi:predicted amidohydrolase YtcJ
MVGLYAAITRRGPDGHVLGAKEAVTREEAVRLYTREAAYLAWDEDKKGSLEVGKLADMIVLDHDLLTEPAEQILSTRVDLTLVGGKVVYDRKTGT